MTDDRTFQPDPATPDPASMSRSALIRAAADGEISPDLVPGEDAARVEFERSLRDAVNRTAPDAKAPAELRDSIARMFRDRADAAPVSPIGGAATRQRSFWNSASKWAAAAAVLALCTTVVVMSLRSGGTGPTAPFGGHQAAVQAASFVQNEADRCTEINDRFNRKFRARTQAEAQELAASMFRSTPQALLRADDALAALGYRFAGFGKCAVPGPGKSAHLVYHAGANHADALSLFIQEDDESLAVNQDCCYLMPGVEKDDPRVVAWKDGGFIYYLFSHNDEAVQTARTIFEAPKREITIR